MAVEEDKGTAAASGRKSLRGRKKGMTVPRLEKAQGYLQRTRRLHLSHHAPSCSPFGCGCSGHGPGVAPGVASYGPDAAPCGHHWRGPGAAHRGPHGRRRGPLCVGLHGSGPYGRGRPAPGPLGGFSGDPAPPAAGAAPAVTDPSPPSSVAPTVVDPPPPRSTRPLLA
nr:WW domain-binding protein 11-like [Aegilops tauschii subsp. strangulata]